MWPAVEKVFDEIIATSPISGLLIQVGLGEGLSANSMAAISLLR